LASPYRRPLARIVTLADDWSLAYGCGRPDDLCVWATSLSAGPAEAAGWSWCWASVEADGASPAEVVAEAVVAVSQRFLV